MAEQVNQDTTVAEEVETETTETVDKQQEEQPSKELDEVAKMQQMIDELQARVIRTHADFDNFRKRSRLEKEETAKYANTRLIESLLPAYDNLQRAVISSKETQNLESLIQGVEMVYRQMEQVLNQEGLEEIEAVGQPFNPELHQAVMQIQSDEFDSGVVVEELQKGYKVKDKVIRPSMVKVNA